MYLESAFYRQLEFLEKEKSLLLKIQHSLEEELKSGFRELDSERKKYPSIFEKHHRELINFQHIHEDLAVVSDNEEKRMLKTKQNISSYYLSNHFLNFRNQVDNVQLIQRGIDFVESELQDVRLKIKTIDKNINKIQMKISRRKLF